MGAAFLFCLAAVSLPGLQAGREDAKAKFEAGIGRCRSFMDRGQWGAARDALKSLLEDHRERDYVRARRLEILEDLKRCAFRSSHEAAPPKSLISGELLSYDPAGGKIALRYRAAGLGDFAVQGEKEDPDAIYLHPVAFDGPYTIEIKGNSYPRLSENPVVGNRKANFAGSPTILAGVVEDEAFLVVFGFPHETFGTEVKWVPSRIDRSRGGVSEELDAEKTPQTRPGKPFSLKVSVTGSEIAAFYDNRKILGARQPKPRYGGVGFCNVPDFTELVLRGKVQPAWIQGLQDAEAQKGLSEFEKRYDPASDAPAWLLADAEGPSAESRVADRAYPGPEGPEQRSFFDEAMRFYRERDFEKGLAFVTGAKEGGASEELREYLLALFHWAGKDFGQALVHCERVCERDPQFLETRKMRAFLYSLLGPREKAIAEYRVLVDRLPQEASHYEDLARFLLEAGRPAEAKAVVERAAAASVRTENLERIQRLFVKADRGPGWAKAFDYPSKHYHVFSDIDRDTCVEAAKVLEDAYLAYTLHLRRIEDLERRKFRVYLFSGEAGYKAYAKDVFQAEPGRTAGMYSPTLKQLLIWNLPDRDAIMRTVRHEGFHQYLDRVADDPPVWFNEGLAEYYELARVDRGEWRTGQVHAAHLRVLRDREKDWIPFRRLLEVDRQTFYEEGELHYAQSWAFVHFLRHASPEKQRLFDALFDAFAGGSGRAEALDRTFAGLDPEKLDLEFRTYVRSLQE